MLHRRVFAGGSLGVNVMAAAPTVTEITGPPVHWAPASLTRTLLDIVYWVNRADPQRASTGWGLGAPTATRGTHSTRLQRNIPAAPSTAAAVHALVSACTYSAEMPVVTTAASVPVDPLYASVVERTINNIATVSANPSACIPISTTFHDETQLRWNDSDHLCASGPDCTASRLSGAPGPLPIYTHPGVDRADVSKPAFCLYCIRADAATVARIAGHVSRASMYSFGMAPVILPVFQNLVNCAGGYYEEALGVTPSQDIFSPISIASASVPAKVVYDNVAECFFIDQSAAVWKPGVPYLPLN